MIESKYNLDLDYIWIPDEDTFNSCNSALKGIEHILDVKMEIDSDPRNDKMMLDQYESKLKEMRNFLSKSIMRYLSKQHKLWESRNN